MSDVSQGPGWWQASDGKWYPPELHPSAPPRLPPPSVPLAVSPYPSGPQAGLPMQQSKPWWRRWWAIAIGVLVLLGGIAAVAGPGDTDDEVEVGAQPIAEIPASSAPAATDADEEVGEQIGEPVPATEPAPEPTVATTSTEPEQPAVGTRESPYAVGSPAQVVLDTFGDAGGSTWTITVDGPGSDMTQAVLSENQFNEPPAEGRLFYGVPVTLRLDAAGKEPLSPLFNISLEFFGPASLEIISDGLSEGCGVTPNAFDDFKEVFVGGAISGTVCFSVEPADVEAGILLTLDEIEGDRIFLATR